MDPNDRSTDDEQPFRWRWVIAGVALGVVLLGTFVPLADPGLARPDVSALVATLTLILVGIVIAYRSPGETVREVAVTAFLLLAIAQTVLALAWDRALPGEVLLMAAFYAPCMAMGGALVGEVLQGTLEEGRDEGARWPWILVGVVIGFLLNVYVLFVLDAVVPLEPPLLLLTLGVSFCVAGWIVGFRSPGYTVVEPGIAALIIAALMGALVALGILEVPAPRWMLVGVAVGVVTAVAGGWLGELAQRRSRRRPVEAEPGDAPAADPAQASAARP